MTIRKLVALDGPYGYPKEVDPKKVLNSARKFKAWLLALSPDDDEFGFLQKDLPIAESVIDGSVSLPYKGWKPHNWESREGLLPREYTKIAAPFYNAIRSAALCMPANSDKPPEVIQKDGKYYAWCEFEEDPENPVTTQVQD
jgi:hypothetical protein